MAEVPDHLVPTDGLTNSNIRFAGLDTISGSHSVMLRYDMSDEDKRLIGTFSITVNPQPSGTADAVLAEGYRQMTNVLRQWLYVMDRTRQAYEKRV